jgi:hypothetical protein
MTPLHLTPARWFILVLCVPLALVTIAATGLALIGAVARGSYPVNFSVPAHGRAVSVSAGSSTVSLGPGTGDTVTVRGKATYSLFRPKVSIRPTATGLAIGSSCHGFIVSCSFRYAIAAPSRLGADVSDASGDLSASGLSGPVTLSDDSGDVTASRLGGLVKISDSSGDITLARLSSPDVRVKDASGDVTLARLSSPDVGVKDASGDVKGAALADPDVTVVDESGDVTLTFTVVPSQVVVTDSSGDITLVLPAGSTPYRVSASTSSGDTSIRVPTSPTSSHVLTATDESGDITIRN